jgi:hypothetical protein
MGGGVETESGPLPAYRIWPLEILLLPNSCNLWSLRKGNDKNRSYLDTPEDEGAESQPVLTHDPGKAGAITFTEKQYKEIGND